MAVIPREYFNKRFRHSADYITRSTGVRTGTVIGFYSIPCTQEHN
jgi:hypothetical protein